MRHKPHRHVERGWRRTTFQPALEQCEQFIPDLLPDVLNGTINPGRVLDYTTSLHNVVDACNAMNDSRSIKALLQISTV